MTNNIKPNDIVDLKMLKHIRNTNGVYVFENGSRPIGVGEIKRILQNAKSYKINITTSHIEKENGRNELMRISAKVTVYNENGEEIGDFLIERTKLGDLSEKSIYNFYKMFNMEGVTSGDVDNLEILSDHRMHWTKLGWQYFNGASIVKTCNAEGNLTFMLGDTKGVFDSLDDLLGQALILANEKATNNNAGV